MVATLPSASGIDDRRTDLGAGSEITELYDSSRVERYDVSARI